MSAGCVPLSARATRERSGRLFRYVQQNRFRGKGRVRNALMITPMLSLAMDRKISATLEKLGKSLSAIAEGVLTVASPVRLKYASTR